MAEGAEKPLDERLLPGAKRRADLVLDAQGLKDAADMLGDVVLAVVGLGDFRHAPAYQGALREVRNRRGSAGFADVELNAAGIEVDDADDAVPAVLKEDIGGRGVEFPDLIGANDALAHVAPADHVLIFPEVWVAEECVQLGVFLLPTLDPAPHGADAGHGNGTIAGDFGG